MHSHKFISQHLYTELNFAYIFIFFDFNELEMRIRIYSFFNALPTLPYLLYYI